MAITVAFNPPDTTALYEGQKLLVTVTVTSSTSPLPTGQSITLTTIGTGFDPDTTAAGINNAGAQPLIIDPKDASGKTGYALFVLDVLSGTPGPVTNLNLTAHGSTGIGMTDTPISYKTLKPLPPLPTEVGPSKPWMTIPTTNPGNPTQNPEYTTTFTVTITDGTNPIPNCVVDWKEVKFGEIFGEVLFGQMAAYVDPTASSPLTTTTAADKWPYGPVAIDPEEGSPPNFIRTVTDSKGVATLYLVANIDPSTNLHHGYAVGEIMPVPSAAGALGVMTFLVADVDLAHVDPDGSVEAPIPGDQVGGFVDYDLTKDDTVPVTINLSADQAHTGDLVFLILNNQYAAEVEWSDDDVTDQSATSSFAKTLGYVGQGNVNTLQYLWLDLSDFSFNVSPAAWFYGKGNTAVLPTGGTTHSPYLPTAGNLIDNDIAASPISIAVPLITLGGWTPTKDDQLTPSAMIMGWDTEGNPRDAVTVTGTPVKIQDTQITNGIATLTLPNASFLDWAHSADSTTERSTAHIRYTVARASSNETWKSKVFTAYVITPKKPPSDD